MGAHADIRKPTGGIRYNKHEQEQSPAPPQPYVPRTSNEPTTDELPTDQPDPPQATEDILEILEEE